MDDEDEENQQKDDYIKGDLDLHDDEYLTSSEPNINP